MLVNKSNKQLASLKLSSTLKGGGWIMGGLKIELHN